MKFNIRMVISMSFLFIISMVLIACSDDSSSAPNNDNNDSNQSESNNSNHDNNDEEVLESQEPVTIKIAFHFGEDVFQTRFGLVEEKIGDHVTIESIQLPRARAETWAALQELFVSEDTTPDIVITRDETAISNLLESGSIQALDDLIEKSDFNIEEINPSLVSYTRSFDPEKRMIGIPDGTGFKGLYYNKEIFDLFGYEYPSGEMNWNEVLDLAANMTGERNGQEYTGLTFHDYIFPLEQWAVNPVDPETDEVNIAANPAIQQHFSLLDQYRSIPDIDVTARRQKFIEGGAAMHVGFQAVLRNWEDFSEVGQDNVDIAPIPIWEDGPKKHPYLGTTPMMILSDSEHIDTAFKILMEYISVENQLRIARQAGSGSVLTDIDILNQYGADLERYEGKNVPAFYKWPAAELKEQSQWDRLIDYKFDDFLESDDDVNTFLRKIEEETEAKIKDEKLKE